MILSVSPAQAVVVTACSIQDFVLSRISPAAIAADRPADTQFTVLLQRAGEFQARDFFLQARIAYEAALVLRPNSADAWFGYGQSMARLGQYLDAIRGIDQAIKFNPSEFKFYLERGQLNFRFGHHSRAIFDLDRALAIKSSSVEARLTRANAYREGGEVNMAMLAYNTVLQTNPDNASAWFHRAVARHRLDLFDRELLDWGIAIRLEPDLYWLYGTTYRHKHLYNEILSDHVAAIQSQPHNAKSYHNRAEAYRYAGHYCQAISDYTTAISLRSGFTQSLVGRGIALLALGEYQKSIEDLTLSMHRRVKIRALYYRSLAYSATGNLASALADIASASEQSPQNPVVQARKQSLRER